MYCFSGYFPGKTRLTGCLFHFYFPFVSNLTFIFLCKCIFSVHAKSSSWMFRTKSSSDVPSVSLYFNNFSFSVLLMLLVGQQMTIRAVKTPGSNFKRFYLWGPDLTGLTLVKQKLNMVIILIRTK